MKYDAMTFLEGLFRQPVHGSASGDALASACDIRVEELDLDWRIEWEERAAIMEVEGGLPRERAEALALAEITGRIRKGERFTAVCRCRASDTA